MKKYFAVGLAVLTIFSNGCNHQSNLTTVTKSSGDEKHDAAMRPDLRLLGGIELTDGYKIHWGEETAAYRYLIAEHVSFAIGDASAGIADLWCDPDDYSRALINLKKLGDSSASGYHPVGPNSGITAGQAARQQAEQSGRVDGDKPPN